MHVFEICDGSCVSVGFMEDLQTAEIKKSEIIRMEELEVHKINPIASFPALIPLSYQNRVDFFGLRRTAKHF